MGNRYIERLFRSAWSITMSDFGFDKPRVLLLKTIIVITTVFILFENGLDSLIEDMVGERWARLVALLFIIPVWFLVNLILAPGRLQKEADDQIKKLESDIEAQKARHKPEYAQQLSEFHQQGMLKLGQPHEAQDVWYRMTAQWIQQNLPEYFPLISNASPPGALRGHDVWVRSKLDVLIQIITEYQRRRHS